MIPWQKKMKTRKHMVKVGLQYQESQRPTNPMFLQEKATHKDVGYRKFET